MIGELSLRIIHYFKWKRPLFFADKGTAEPLYPEKKLGWRATEGYFSQWIAYDAAGKPYQVRGTTDKNGFRFFGNPDSNRIKIFVLGDSFTQAAEVSNEKTYYALLAKNFNNLELFAYGAGGYGTLQEYLILDEFIDRIRPKILLLQLCTNDFYRNDYDLEHRIWNNPLRRRPYLDAQGKIFYKNPGKFSFLVSDTLLDNSRLVYYVFLKINKLMVYLNRNNKINIESNAFMHRAYLRSVDTTRKIMAMIKKRTPGVEIFTFCADDAQPFYDEMRKLSEESGFHFIDGVPQAIREAEKQGKVTKHEDRGHWNELGHLLVAEQLTAYFREHEVLKKLSQATPQNQPAEFRPLHPAGLPNGKLTDAPG